MTIRHHLLASVLALSFLILSLHIGFTADIGTFVGGDITTDQIWNLAGSPYYLQASATVYPDVTLTIEPGVKVIAEDAVFLDVNGDLIAEGTATAPILFTSVTKQAGAWDGINIAGDTSDHPASVRLRYVTIEYAAPIDQPGYGALNAYQAAINVRDSLFRASGSNGIATFGQNAVQISDSRFVDNRGAALEFSNISGYDPVLSNLSANGNTLDGVVYYQANLDGQNTLENMGLPYVLRGGFSVSPNANVTIASGVEIRVETSFDMAGTLNAIGTNVAPITFTSMTKTPGSWLGINIEGYSEQLAHARFDHVVLEYGGQPGDDSNANLQIASAVVTMTNSIIRNGGSTGIAYRGGALDQGQLTLQDSSVVNNAGKAYWSLLVLGDPVLHNLVIKGNGIDALVQKGEISGNHVWEYVGVPYMLEWPTGIANGELVIEPGVDVYIEPGSQFNVRNAALFAIGTQTQPITFSAAPLQLIGKQTTELQPGAWVGIYASDSSIIHLQNCDIGYGGSELLAMVTLDSSAGIIADCRLHHSAAAAVEVKRSNLTPPETVRITHNRIDANREGVVQAVEGGSVDARNNWWGDASGPTHASNPGGKGQSVSDSVLFRPWLQIPQETDAPDSLEVSLTGPQKYGPGATAWYAVSYNNASSQLIPNAVLRVMLPAVGELTQIGGNGIAWPQQREVFWLLGTVPPRSGNIFTYFQMRYPWGLPEGMRSTLLAQISGEGLSPTPFDTKPYLAIVPTSIINQSDLATSQVQAERTSHPGIETLYSQAIAAGFRYGSAQSRQHNNGVVEVQILLLRFQPRLAAFIITRQNDSISGAMVDGSSYSVYKPGESIRFELQTDAWQSSAPLSAADISSISWKECMKQCIAEKLPGHLVKETIKAIDVADAALDCIKSLKGDDSAIPGCSQIIARKIPGYSQGVELGQCNVDCKVCEKSDGGCDDDTCHCCTQDKYRCDGADWLYGTFGIDVKKVRKCSNDTGRYLAEEVYQICGVCEKCVEGANGPSCQPKSSLTASLVAVSGSSDLACEECVIPHDPNKLFGPQGNLLPGQLVTYTIAYENLGQGEAFDVYIIDELDNNLDLDTLVLTNNGGLSAPIRTIFWQVGTLAPKGERGSTGEISFSVRLKTGLPSGTVIQNQAVVYFPSVPEETPTNVVVNVVQPMVAIPQALQTNASEPLQIVLQGRDVSDLPLTVALTEIPLYGTLSGVPPTLTYTSSFDFSGLDRFQFSVTNGVTTSQPAEVTIRVLPSLHDKTAPTVLWTAPGSNEIVSLATVTQFQDGAGALYYFPLIQAQFSEPISATTLNTTTVQVTKPDGMAVPIALRYDNANDQLVILLNEAPQTGIIYQAKVKASVADLMGNQMGTDYQWLFGVDTSMVTTVPNSIYLPWVSK